MCLLPALEEGKSVFNAIQKLAELGSYRVAVQALQFAIAAGATVFVTSGKAEKIEEAKKLGATGGVNYKEEDWPKKLQAMLPKDRPYLDAVIDSAGGNVTTLLVRILKHGARVAVYGQ